MVIMKKIILITAAAIFLLLLQLHVVIAQQTDSLNNLALSRHFKFSVASVFYEPLRITNTGKDYLKTLPCPSFASSISFYQGLGGGFGINLGVGYDRLANLCYYSFQSPESSIYHTYGYDTIKTIFKNYFLSNTTFPLTIQKTFKSKTKRNRYYSVEAGIKYNINQLDPMDFEFTDEYFTDNKFDTLFYMYIFGKVQSPISYIFKTGIIWITQKNNYLTLNLTANLSKPIGEGYYTFWHLNKESYGRVEQSINYVGVEFVYGYNRENGALLKNVVKKMKYLIPKYI